MQSRLGGINLKTRQEDFQLIGPSGDTQAPQDALVIEHLMLHHDVERLFDPVGQQEAAAVGGIAATHRYPGKPGQEGCFKGVLQQDCAVETFLP